MMKLQAFLPSRFFCQSDEDGVLIILEKCVFHNLNLQIMKINNEVNFLQPYFLITRNRPPNTNIPYKYTDWVWFFCWFLLFSC